MPGPAEHVLVVSPHLDDAALSIGGTLARLAQAGSIVVVATLFTGLPPGPPSAAARAFHQSCGLGDDAMRVRMAEDTAACTTLGVRHRHVGLLEALYRTGDGNRPRYADGRSIFQAGASEEPGEVRTAENEVRSLLEELRPRLLFGPIGVGGHIDHLITHVAVERAADGVRLFWFEDLPYSLYPEERGWQARLPARWRSRVVSLSGTCWRRKIAAVGCYTSQLDVVWRDPKPWPELLRDYAVAVGRGRPAERLWQAGDSEGSDPKGSPPRD